MRVDARQDDSTLVLEFTIEPQDQPSIVAPDGRVKATFLGGECRYQLPEGWRLDDTHPDLLAAVCLLIGGDRARQQFVAPRPVSAAFAEQVDPRYKLELMPVDPALPARTPPPGGRIGLSFSGGVDSTAALALLPAESAAAFLERVPRPNDAQRSMYRKDAAVRACEVLHRAGRDVYRVLTDVEHSRTPIGFMNDGVMATPLMLLADQLHLNALAYGLILESSYLNKGFRYREYAKTDHWRRYGGTSTACGLPWHLITAGLSEVVTSRVVLESPFHHVAQSCIRGTFGAPCLNCWKCFRKSLLEAALLDVTLPNAQLERFFAIHEASKKLHEVPIKHENVMMYLLQKYTGTHPAMCVLRELLDVEGRDLSWMERWYPQSREVFAPLYGDSAEATLARRLPRMTDADVAAVRAWDRIADCTAAGRVPTPH